jgi:hypothetical protein
MDQQIHTGTASTAMEILAVVERNIITFLREFNGALDQLDSDLNLREHAEYKRLQQIKIGVLGVALDLVVDYRKSLNSGDDVIISLPYREASRATDVAGEMQYMLNQASEVFRMLGEAISNDGIRYNDNGVSAFMEIAGRAFDSMAATEGVIMSNLSEAPMLGVSQHAKAKLQSTYIDNDPQYKVA